MMTTQEFDAALTMLTPEERADYERLIAHFQRPDIVERVKVRHLGEDIGYGNLMHLARDEWRESLKHKGIEGGELAVGCCVALTVPCGCAGSCDWCNGCGWITPKVKELRDAQ